MKPFAKKAVRVAFSKATIISAGLLTSVVIARILGPEKNGEIAAILVYPSLFMSLGTFGIRQATTYAVGKSLFKMDEIKSVITKIWLASSLFGCVISFYLIYFVGNATDEYMLVILAISPIPMKLLNNFSVGLFLGRNKISAFNKINWIPPVITFLFTIILVYALELGIEGFLSSILAGNLSVFLIIFFKLGYSNQIFESINYVILKKLIKLGFIYAIALLVITLNYKLDIILLDQLSNSKVTGIYSKGANIAHYLWQLPMLFSALIFAGSANSSNDLRYSKKVILLFRVTFLISVVIAIILWLSSNFLVVFLFGSDFADSAQIINILLPGVVFLMVFKVLNMDLAGKGKPLVSLKAMLPALIINIIMNFMLIPKYGAEGAAFASSVSYGVGGLLFLFFYSKAVNIRISNILHLNIRDLKALKEFIK